MLPRNFSCRYQAYAGLPVLRRLSRILISCLLLCLSIDSLHAQTLPAGYELQPLGGGLNGVVAAVNAIGDDIYYGGSFTQAYNALNGNSQTEPADNTRYIARWDGRQWHPLGGGTNRGVEAIAYANDGSIYVGGKFTQVTQVDGATLAVNYIARFKNGQWSAVGSGTNDYVYALEIVERASGGHDLYVGGHFTTATDSSGIKTVERLAKWDGNSWNAVGAGVDGIVLSIVYSKAHGGLYIGGAFTNANAFSGNDLSPLNHVSFWNLAQQQWRAMDTGTDVDYGRVGSFQETADGHSVFVSGEHGLSRFDWNTNSWITLSASGTYGMQLLPDQKRLITLTDMLGAGLQLWNISMAPPVPQTLAGFYTGVVMQTTAIHRSGVYLGFGYNADQHQRAARLIVPDMDGDVVANDDDNCPLHSNNNQLDTDLDGAGDLCDICPEDGLDNCLANPAGDFDGDGVNNGQDAFPSDPNEWADDDNDGVGDNNDLCLDDVKNNCLNNPNGDFDGDGVVNSRDRYPEDSTRWSDTNDQEGRCIRPNV